MAAAILRNSAVVLRTRPRAIALAMTTVRISTHGFLSCMRMGLRLAALRAAGAPLQYPFTSSYVNMWFYNFEAIVQHATRKRGKEKLNKLNISFYLNSLFQLNTFLLVNNQAQSTRLYLSLPAHKTRGCNKLNGVS